MPKPVSIPPNLSHKFRIVVRRSMFYDRTGPCENNKILRLTCKFADAALDNGSVRVQLETNRYRHTSFYYDLGVSRKVRVVRGLAAIAAATALTYMIPRDALPTSVSIPLSVAASVTAAFMAQSLGRGKVYRAARLGIEDAALEFPITARRYHELREDLSALCEKRHHGIYSMLFSNCASFALDYARKEGFDVPRLSFPSPSRLGRYIEKTTIIPNSPPDIVGPPKI